MTRPLKKLVTIAGALVVLVIVLFVAALMYINTIARKAIEAGGTYALGVQTTLGSASVGIFSGTFAMSRLHIANPQGFQGDHFLKLGDGGVAVSLGTIMKDVVEMPSLTMTDLSVRLEKQSGKSNYGVILDNLKKLQSGQQPQPASQGGTEKKFIVNELAIRDIKIHAELLGAPGPAGAVLNPVGTFDIPIGEIRLTNVGKTGTGVGGTGVTMKELAGIVVQAVMAAAVEKGGGILPADMLGELQNGLGGLKSLSSMGIGAVSTAAGAVTGAAGEALKGAGKAGEEAKKAIDEGGKKIEEGIKGLIPGKK